MGSQLKAPRTAHVMKEGRNKKGGVVVVLNFRVNAQSVKKCVAVNCVAITQLWRFNFFWDRMQMRKMWQMQSLWLLWKSRKEKNSKWNKSCIISRQYNSIFNLPVTSEGSSKMFYIFSCANIFFTTGSERASERLNTQKRIRHLLNSEDRRERIWANKSWTDGLEARTQKRETF